MALIGVVESLVVSKEMIMEVIEEQIGRSLFVAESAHGVDDGCSAGGREGG